jgi:type VI secretion system protein ImpK
LFGIHIAGEVFFQNLQQLLGRQDSQDLADLLEIHLLCMLLGFSGRYSVGHRGELGQTIAMTREKIQRVRGPFGPLSPGWSPPTETLAAGGDPWVRKLAAIAIACAAVTLLLFAGYKIGLGSGVSDVHNIAVQAKG